MQEIKELWGIPVLKLKEYGKRYRLMSIGLFLINAVTTMLAVFLMYTNGSDFQTYIFVLVLICIIIICWFNFILSPNRWAAYKFYRRHINDSIEIRTYNVSPGHLYNVLYCSKYRRLKMDKDLNYYKDLMLSACCEDYVYASRFMKYLSKYESESGNLSLVICKCRKKLYFINFEEKENTNG